MDETAVRLLEIGDGLFTDRGSLPSYWQEVADNFYPERADFTRTIWQGQELGSHLMESYPVIARRELGNALSTMLRPRAKRWFHPRTGREEVDEKPDVKRWLEYAQGVLYRAIYDPKAQLVRATKQADHDYVAFGNAVISIEEAAGGRAHFTFRNWHLRDCSWAENEVGVVDTLHRKMKMSARNMLGQFPGKVHSSVETAAKREPGRRFEVRHIAVPSDEYQRYGGKKPPKAGLDWAHVYIDVDNQVVLKETWRPEFGYVVPRWHMVGGFAYGWSPATTAALSDARMIQQIARVLLENAEKAIDPPLVGTMEAVRSDINIYAGGVTWVDREYDERLGQALRPLEINGDVRLGVELQQAVRSLLAEAFYLNKLMVPARGDMTATEVQVRVEEFIRAALPVFEPVEVEYNAPLLETAWDMLLRRRAFGRADEYPPELADHDVSFIFDSPIQTAEKSLRVASYMQSAQIVQLGAQADQSLIGVLDWHKAAADAIDGTGAPADWLADEEAIAAAKEAQAGNAKLGEIANLLSSGAGVAGQVADASMKMQEAGLV